MNANGIQTTIDRPPKDTTLAIAQLWQKVSALMGLINALQLQTATPAKASGAAKVLQQGVAAGGYEPLITPKSIGYLKYNGSGWMFVNQQYDQVGEMTVLILQGLDAAPAKIAGKMIIYWLLASPGIIYALFDDGTTNGKDYIIFDGTAGDINA